MVRLIIVHLTRLATVLTFQQVMVRFSTTRTFDVKEDRNELDLILLQLTLTIKQDLKLTQDDISNSNIVALVATYAVLSTTISSLH